MKKLEKNYVFVDSKTILMNALQKQQDIYYYDDTHWSPRAGRLIAEELKSIISGGK